MSNDDGPSGHRALREVLGRYATGVAVVTTRHLGRAAGLTVNSFTSVSLDPPLVLWCLNRASANRPAFTLSPHFAVHVLAADQRRLAVRFAGPGDRFERLRPLSGPYGLPLLEGVLATLVCRREQVITAGDHVILTGTVLEHRAEPGPPLLFLDGRFHAGPHPAAENTHAGLLPAPPGAG
ncbi:flavin reductase family protein [Kitasatospora sp. MAP5-34]|uniref:flavin reductase family protein n=1 Tax=Kitasatospora sp. MAP5-34 TaxID=3035102 RepID=UPI0024750A1F|nr:flavin reductase family protein [Kitasatospora sp. MAP5-34]MDH6574487.1 flavin reductase (DIM6/NTAB) family NADH-FMN oxidoreductase RutF [Kitasatospora sp. MAP5-34]